MGSEPNAIFIYLVANQARACTSPHPYFCFCYRSAIACSHPHLRPHLTPAPVLLLLPQICNQGFTNADARVICRMLGLPLLSAQQSNTMYAIATGSILMTSVSCTGRESSIQSCQWSKPSNDPFRRGSHFPTCTHLNDVSVVCQ